MKSLVSNPDKRASQGPGYFSVLILFANGQSEVSNIRRGVRTFEQNVAGLHVPVYQPPVMVVMQSLCDRCYQLGGFIMARMSLFAAISYSKGSTWMCFSSGSHKTSDSSRSTQTE